MSGSTSGGRTSVIDIDIRDEAFTKLKDSFDKFNEAVKKQPEAWGKVYKEAQALAGSIGFAEGSMQGLADNTDKFTKHAVTGRKIFGDIAAASTKFAKDIADATKSMLSWVGIGSIFTGLLGGGGLFGLERFARAAQSGSRSSQGLGVSYGEQQSFRLNYGRYVNPDDFLKKIADAQKDYTKLAFFQSVGIQGDVRNRNTQELAMEYYRKARSAYANSDGSQQFIESRGINNFLSLDELRRSKAYSNNELDASERDTRRDNSQLDLDPKTQSAWRALDTALEKAAVKIETVLIKGLEPLAGPLAGIVDKFSDLLKTLLETPALKEWMVGFASGLESLNKWMGSPDFKTDVESFAENISKLAHGVVNAVKWLEAKIEWLFGDKNKAPGAATPTSGSADPLKPFNFETVNNLGSGVNADGNPATGIMGWLGITNHTPDHEGLAHKNNPFNLSFRDQPGASPDPNTKPGGHNFADFGSIEQAAAAELNLFKRYQSEGVKSINDMILKHTPRSENPNVDNYIKDVAKLMGMKPEDVPDFNDPKVASQFLLSIAKNEGNLAKTDRGGVIRGVHSALGLPMPSGGTALDEANRHLGQGPSEINQYLKDHGQEIDAAKQAWCAAFVNASLSAVGVQGTGSLAANSFEKWGQYRNMTDVQRGDILVKNKPGKGGHGHVGFATGRTRYDANGNMEVELTSGNWGNKVATDWVPADQYDARYPGGTAPINAAGARTSHNDNTPASPVIAPLLDPQGYSEMRLPLGANGDRSTRDEMRRHIHRQVPNAEAPDRDGERRVVPDAPASVRADRAGGARVTIYNNTGGNAIVVAGAVAA